MRKPTAVLVAVTLAACGAAACASKRFVRGSVGATNKRVNELVEALEETQARTARHERRIGEVDAKTRSAHRTAEAARAAARDASAAAAAAGTRLDAIDRTTRGLVYGVALEAEESHYRSQQTEPSEAARMRLDGIIHGLLDDPRHVFIELEGHTDDRGPRTTNTALGLARAEAVRRYLHEVHEIPLHKMNVITFGADKPVATNATESGRARNRRVVLRIRG